MRGTCVAIGLLAAALGGAGVPAASAAEEKRDRPNILWFITEDMGPDLGCYGEPQSHTPNLDAFAEEGMRYTRAFTPTPVCSSSRSSFMTGMYATSIDAHNHRSHRHDNYTLPEGVRVLTDWLRPHGYYTANVRQLPDPIDWRGTGKRDWNFNYEGRAGKNRPFDTHKWSDLKDHQPFYAQINISESHRDFHGPKKADPEKVDLPPYYPDHPLARKDWARYLDTVSVADRKFGQVMDLLEKEGLAKNTIVVMFGDHGRAMIRGKQWPYDSGLRVPFLIRWPENFEPPEGYEAGKVTDRMINVIDLAAQTLSFAGIEPPMLMQGRRFLGEKAAPPRRFIFGARGRGDETVFRIRSVRSDRYRYIRNYYPERPFLQINRYKEAQYPVIDLMRRLHEQDKLTPPQEKLLALDRPAEELYDLKNDPHEINNLIDSEKDEHRHALMRLRAALDTWIMETNDQGRFPEDPSVVERSRKRMKKAYGERIRNQSEAKYERMMEFKRRYEKEAKQSRDR